MAKGPKITAPVCRYGTGVGFGSSGTAPTMASFWAESWLGKRHCCSIAYLIEGSSCGPISCPSTTRSHPGPLNLVRPAPRMHSRRDRILRGLIVLRECLCRRLTAGLAGAGPQFSAGLDTRMSYGTVHGKRGGCTCPSPRNTDVIFGSHPYRTPRRNA